MGLGVDRSSCRALDLEGHRTLRREDSTVFFVITQQGANETTHLSASFCFSVCASVAPYVLTVTTHSLTVAALT